MLSPGKTRAKWDFHIWGRHPVESYLAELTKVESFDTKEFSLHIIVDKAGKAPAQLRNVVELAKSFGIGVKAHTSVEDGWPLEADDDIKHQRVCLKVPKLETCPVHRILAIAGEAKVSGVCGSIGLVLDQIQDPRNFGAILRNAGFFGAKFVVFGKDRQAGLSPVVAKTSAGGVFAAHLCEVVNISRTLTQLKEAGAWMVGTSLEATISLDQLPKDRPFVIVLGNEAKGLRLEVARHCDFLVRIPGGGAAVESLNVSVAAGIVCHALRVEDKT